MEQIPLDASAGLLALLASPRVPAGTWFDAVARALLREWRLSVGDKVYAPLELEFYLHCAGHEDPFVHRAPAQLDTTACWYFHRAKSATRRFTLKGLDLTFGRPGLECGGVLIRAMREVSTGEYVEGPSKVVDAVLDAHGFDSVAELQADPWYEDAATECTLLNLTPAPAPRKGVGAILKAPRHGLSEKNRKPRAAEFRAALYRYRASAHLAVKGKAAFRGALSLPEPGVGA